MSERQTHRLRWLVVGLVLLGTIIVPFILWGEALERAILEWMRAGPSTGTSALVLVGLLASDVLLPIPSSAVAVAAGMRFGMAGGTAGIALGLTLGCVIGYGLGIRLGAPGLHRFVDDAERSRVEAFARRHGDVLVILLRPVPVLAEASVLFAGATRMPLRRFGAWTLLANVILGAVYAGAGSYSIQSGRLDIGAMAACAVPCLGLLLVRRLRPAQAPDE